MCYLTRIYGKVSVKVHTPKQEKSLHHKRLEGTHLKDFKEIFSLLCWNFRQYPQKSYSRILVFLRYQYRVDIKYLNTVTFIVIFSCLFHSFPHMLVNICNHNCPTILINKVFGGFSPVILIIVSLNSHKVVILLGDCITSKIYWVCMYR